MTTIAGMLRNVQSLDLRMQVPVLVQQTAYEAIRLNKDQMFHGLTSEGTFIKEQYKNTEYAKRKEDQNPLPGFLHPDYYLTGSFYNGFEMVVEGYNYRLDSTDSKTASLIERSKGDGTNIFGLTAENKGIYSQGVLFQSIKDYIRSKGVPIG